MGALALINFKIQGYSINYYDCQDINQITTYKLGRACEPQTAGNATLFKYTLVQDRSITKIRGYSCQVTRTTLTEYCGAYSHQKLAKIPDIELNVPITPSHCLDMVHQQIFTTPDKRQESIKIGTLNVIKSFDLGTIQANDDGVSCRGQPERIGINIVNDILQVSQWKILVRQENFMAKDNRVETMDHLRLPCSMESQGCQTVTKTFVWVQPESKCSLEEVRTVDMHEVNGYLVDEEHKIILKKGSFVPAPQGCPTTLMYATEYPNLYLTEPGGKWPAMTTDLDFSEFVKARDDYIVYTFERQLQSQDAQTRQHVCHKALTEEKHNEIINVQGNQFIRRNGDTVEHFQCAEKVGKIIDNSNICYSHIPIHGGFVKIRNRLFTSHSATQPCNQMFGVKLYTNEKVWIELTPSGGGIKKMIEPEDLPLQGHKFHHEDLSGGGIYTEKELEAWKNHLELGDYQDAVMKTISFGVCNHRGDCPAHPSSPHYNLDHLNAITSTFETLSLWKRFNRFVQSWAVYLCLIVIGIETMRLCIFISVICQTMIWDGIMGVRAVIYLMCCRSKQQADKVNRRHRRIQHRRRYVDSTHSSTAEEMGMMRDHAQEPDVAGSRSLDVNVDETEDTIV